MADSALNPRKPDDATKAKQAQAGGAPAETEELDLESQVDALLAEVSTTVEQISRKLETEPQPTSDDALSGNEIIDDEGSIGTEETASTEPPPAGEDTPTPTEPQTIPTDADEPTGETTPNETEDHAPQPQAPEGTEATDAEPLGEQDTEAEAAEQPVSEQEPVPDEAVSEEEPVSEEPVASDADEAPSVSAESVQAELEAALADLAGGHPEADPDAAEHDPEALANAERTLLRDPDAPAAVPEVEPGETPRDYLDAEALDDELAALADNDDLDTLGSIEDISEPDPGAATVPAAETEAKPEGETRAPQPSSRVEAGTAPDDTTRRWGWLPPKPAWDEVYGRARWLVVAWRHIAWVVPPLSVFLWEKTKTGARRAEPHARHAVAVVAAPLSRRDERTRSMIGYLSVSTLFWAACVWLWVLVGRGPVVPTPDAPPTTLAGETNTASARD